MSQFHVIDYDVTRRNKIARFISKSRHHAEVYESVNEFLEHGPTNGLLLAASELGSPFWDAVSEGKCEMPFAMYGARPKSMEVAEAIRGGALDFLEWPLLGEKLLSELERLLLDSVHRKEAMTFVQDAKKNIASLSPRERGVLQLVTRGFSNKGIGKELGISPRTVDVHRGNILKKLSAQSSADAARIAICAGLDPNFRVIW